MRVAEQGISRIALHGAIVPDEAFSVEEFRAQRAPWVIGLSDR